MVSLSLNQFFLLYTSFLLAILFMFVILIARYYEKISGERTFFRYLALPILLFGGAGVRYASLDHLYGDTLADLFLGIGGLVTVVICWRIYRCMLMPEERS